MPVEKKTEGRCKQGSCAGSSAVAAGKKRKKKKKSESAPAAGSRGAKLLAQGAEKAESCLKTSEADMKLPGTGFTVRAKSETGPSLVMIGSAAAVLKCNDRSSSSSSVENSRPTTKVGRFDYSSSDAMSIGGQTSASSSAAMEISNGDADLQPSHHTQHPSNLSIMSRSESVPSSRATQGADIHASQRTATAGMMRDASVREYQKDSVDLALESLRWEQEYSDEEKEKERIEIYKENRRKRYENALAERRAQLQLQASNRVKYIIS